MLVDVHAHGMPADVLTEYEREVSSVTTKSVEGEPFLCYPEGRFPLAPGFTDIDARLEWMENQCVDECLVSVSTPEPNNLGVPDETVVTLSRTINESLASHRDNHPEKLSGLASLPLREPAEALAELERVHNDYDLAGVLLPTNVQREKLSAPKFRPIFNRLEELDTAILIHPVHNRLSTSLNKDEKEIAIISGFPTETTFQISRLIFDGFFDRHSLNVVLSHLGGALPYLAERLERGRSVFRSAEDPPDRPIQSYLEEFYYDTIVFHQPAMEAAFETVGSGQLVFGTDYPFGMAEPDVIEGTIDNLSLSQSEQDAVRWRTAADIFSM